MEIARIKIGKAVEQSLLAVAARRLVDIPRLAADSLIATFRFTEMKLSGLTEIESMPHSTRSWANSG